LTGAASSILELHGVRRYFPVRGAWGRRVGWVRALDDVSLDVRPGETLGIVGESGCGKSTLGKTVMGIHRPMAGQIVFEGREIGSLSPAERRKVARRLQYVYQDPGASLDPRWKIHRSLHEPLVVHTAMRAAEREARVHDVLRAVGLPETHLELYPHELSGGQQRRVGLARILMLQPSLVILDEPTSGLDVSVQATVLKLFQSLQREFRLTCIFISHDLSVVRMMCHRVAVMYLGRVVEIADTAQLFQAPEHPYTRSLLAAMPQIGGRRVTDEFWLEGEPPDASNLPSGCRFRPRCPLAATVCAEQDPMPRDLDRGEPGRHAVACHMALERESAR
jgi:oligopeptide/dipeptide ABC transporter ATP-binding protein